MAFSILLVFKKLYVNSGWCEMEVFPGWYERYRHSAAKRYGHADTVPVTYLNYNTIIKAIEDSFTDPVRINDVLWDQLAHADSRIVRASLSHVCNFGWGGQEKLMTILQELVLEGKKQLSLDDYL